MNQILSQLTKAELAEITASCACANVRKAARVITQYYDEALRSSGLRATQLPLLVKVALAGSLPVTRLAEELVMDRTTLTRNLKPLENQGLITIDEGSDRRIRLIRPTTQGLQALALALPIWQQAQDQVKNLLGSERWHTLFQTLELTLTLPHAQ
jgi:DNA-binding MarR family transcriptional regulator